MLMVEQKDEHTRGLTNDAKPLHDPALERPWCWVGNYCDAIVAYKYTIRQAILEVREHKAHTNQIKTLKSQGLLNQFQAHGEKQEERNE